MKENAKFLKCPICDNIIELIDGDVQHIICCGRKMEESRSGAPGLCRRSPCGERGLKSLDDIEVYKWRGRSPCGERGLKSKLSPS